MDWLSGLKNNLPFFLDHQRDGTIPGYFSYSFSGDLYKKKRTSNLAGSIFALKLYRLIGESDERIIKPIVDRVLSFQQADGTFRDPLVCRKRLLRNILSNLKHGRLTQMGNEQYIRAETRQAYSALMLYDVLPQQMTLQIPIKPNDVEKFLRSLDWSHPWGAGSHFSHLMFFFSLLRRTGQLHDQNFLEAQF